MRVLRAASLTALAAAAASLAATAEAAPSAPPPVKTLSTSAFGRVLVTRSQQAIYFWTPERRDHRIHCTKGCAKAWPPVVVARGVAVPTRVAGIRGRFGTIRRADGRRQLTLDRVPLYTYAHERPRQVLCDDVDGWFVVRVRR